VLSEDQATAYVMEFIVDRRGLKDISVVARYQQVTRGQADSAL
jgi:hypothetical protein